MYSEVFPSRIKLARHRTGFTQEEVAKALNMTQQTLARYETGTREPDFETLGTLAEFYGVSTDWLLGLSMQGNRPNYERTSIHDSTVGNVGNYGTINMNVDTMTAKQRRRIAKSNAN
jgi:transcriptional regulator with XRE-family HTH domain